MEEIQITQPESSARTEQLDENVSKALTNPNGDFFGILFLSLLLVFLFRSVLFRHPPTQ